ncbi:hypothetical protein DL766_008354 [Monosporascus sp. MC13-8B]|uniref:HNH nuclease domain-containing protein n=1 Tax=Monosporascus cannonballus TaxID=155416 RepID=A0ABY0H3M5_9PEZI|nr:hypothetical protein DL762_005867 [Monosporascus cannonballus]RYO87130.1 hypothetical protein DL763_006484 [Monosporascus cannonballus]RYP19790.1 hypothetical protein DL766_008354 [Monosporascus sp. MC13-8B]
MDAPQQDSLFFKLFPLEIRRRIYEEYADDYLWNIMPIDLTENDNRTHFRAGSWVSPYPPLLLACKRLAREARPILQHPFVEHTLLYAVGSFQPPPVRKLRLELRHRFEYPGDSVNHQLQPGLDILFPDRAKLPATEVNIIFPYLEWIRFVPWEQKDLLGHYVEFLRSLHTLEKVKASRFYHPEWLQFLKQELSGITVKGDGREWEEDLDLGQDDCAWGYDWSSGRGSGRDKGWCIDSGSRDVDMALEREYAWGINSGSWGVDIAVERDYADVYFQDNDYDDDYDEDSDENNNDDDSKDGGDDESMDWEP